MSVHGASQMKCVACDAQVPLDEARRIWWICTTCGSYMCPNCRAIFLESGNGTCPGTIVRGVEPHPPHFTQFLDPRLTNDEILGEEDSSIVILGDVPRQGHPKKKGGKVIILQDKEREPNDSDPNDEGKVS
ncbi:MAG: hypothetical protein ACFFDJ_02025 [Candidatus Odinarchaeota archaeon]